MNTKKATKRALLTSVMALVMCVVMLVGTTFAWFTDTASTAVNKIQAGNLDIELEYKYSGMTVFEKANKDTPVFDKDALWEPGHVEYVVLKVRNIGNLALKYKLGINIASETGSTNFFDKPFKLSDYIRFAVINGDQSELGRGALVTAAGEGAELSAGYAPEGHLVPAAKADNTATFSEKTVTLVVWMPTTVGNEANHKTDAAAPIINLGINVVATQDMVESDSFNNEYDKDAQYPTLTTGKTLNEVFGGANFDFGSTNPSANVVLDGQGLVTVSDYVDGWFAGDVTIKGVTFMNGVCFTAKNDGTTGTITFEDCTFYACDQRKIDLTPYLYNSLKNSGDGLCLNVDTKNSPDLKVVVKGCTFIGEDDTTLDRNGWNPVGGQNWNFDTATKTKSRGHAIMINGISGGGNNAQAESVLIDGCTMSGIRGHAIQLYQLRMPVTIKDCKINSWGRNAQTAAGSKDDAAIRGDIADATNGTLTLKDNYFGLNEKANNILHVKVDSFSYNTNGSRTAGTY